MSGSLFGLDFGQPSDGRIAAANAAGDADAASQSSFRFSQESQALMMNGALNGVGSLAGVDRNVGYVAGAGFVSGAALTGAAEIGVTRLAETTLMPAANQVLNAMFRTNITMEAAPWFRAFVPKHVLIGGLAVSAIASAGYGLYRHFSANE